MPSPIPGPAPIDAVATTPSLRTLGTGSQQAISGPKVFGTVEFVSGGYTLTGTDRYVQITTHGVNLNLAPLAGFLDGEAIVIQDKTGSLSGFPVTVTPNGAEHIDGSSSPLSFATDSATLILRKTGTGWWSQSINSAGAASGVIPSYTLSTLPTPDGSSRIARITDGSRGLVASNGVQWTPLCLDVYRLEDFGGKSDGVTDNLAAWNAMFAAFGPTLGNQIILEAGTYYFSQTPKVSRVCKIVGAGSNFLNPLTIILTQDGYDGILFEDTDGFSGTSAYSTIQGVCVKGTGYARHWAALTSYSVGSVVYPSYWGGLAWVCTSITTGISGASEPAFTVRIDNLPDTDGDVIVDAGVTWTSKVIAGFQIKAGVYITECQALAFTGDGFHVQQVTNSANDGSMINCVASNNLGNGYYWANANANAWNIYNCYAVENGMWGFRDRSFLGNHFFGPNTAANGYVTWTPSTTASDFHGFNGVAGLAAPTQYGTGFIYLADDLSHVTGTTEPTWPLTLGGTVTDGTVIWTAIAHWSGGSIQVTNLNAYTTINSAYTELGTVPMDLVGSATVVTGGLNNLALPVKATAFAAGTNLDTNNVTVGVNAPGFGKVEYQLGSSNPGSQQRLFGYRAYDASLTERPGSSFDFSYWDSGYFAGSYALTHLFAAPGITPYMIATGASPYQPAGALSFPNGFWWYGGSVTLNTFGTAAPTSGTWRKGDHVDNYSPSAGDPVGWRCLIAGTPGTWEPLYSSGASVYTLEQFGGKADGTTDNLAAWNAIMAAGGVTNPGQNVSGPVIKLGTGVYHFSDTLNLTIPCRVEGSGSAYAAARTIIDLPIGKRGMNVKQTALLNQATGSYLKGFLLQSSTNPPFRTNNTAYIVGDVARPPVSPYSTGIVGTSGWEDTGYLYVCSVAGTTAGSPPSDFSTQCNTDATRTEIDQSPFTDGTVTWTPVQCHGMNVGANSVTFEDIDVKQFAGDGWHCFGDTTNTSVDSCRFLNCGAFENSGSGSYVKGPDSSINYFESFNSLANGGWAVKDLGFLGNTYISAGCRSNGTGGGGGGVWVPNNFGWFAGVRAGPRQQNGFLYGVTSIVGGGTYGTTGSTEPVWPTTPGVSVTDNNIVFTCLRPYDGGSYFNRNSIFLGCYSEADSQPSVGGSGAGGFYQGFHGAGFQTDLGLNGSGLVEFGRYTNSRATQSKIVDPGQDYGITSYFGPETSNPNVFGWERFLLADSSLILGSGVRIQYSHVDGYWYFINSSNFASSRIMGIPTDAAADLQTGPMLFPNGIKIDTTKILSDVFLGHLASSYNKGDIVLSESSFSTEGSYTAFRSIVTGAISTPGNMAPTALSPNFYGKIVDTLTPLKETDLHVVYDDELVTGGGGTPLNFADRVSQYTVNQHGAVTYNNAQFVSWPGIRTSYGRNRQITYGGGAYFSLTAASAHTIQSTDQITIEAVIIGIFGLEVETLIGYKTVAGTCGYSLFTQVDGSVRFQIYNTTPGNYVDLVSPAATLNSGNKHCYHVAVTIDMVNSVFALYVNGVLQQLATSTTGSYVAANADIGLASFLQNGTASAGGNNTGNAEIMRTRRLLTAGEIVERSAQIRVANGDAKILAPGVETLLSTTIIDASISTVQTLYTVPTGRSLIITKVIARSPTSTLVTYSATVGYGGSANNISSGISYPSGSGYAITEGFNNAAVGVAADILGLKNTLTQAATSLTVDVFGYLF